MSKKLLLFALIIFSISSISAGSCEVRLREECQIAPWNNVVLGLYNTENAHAEVWSSEVYNYVLCCDFYKGRECEGKNKILGLYRNTNSHVEMPGKEIYPLNVCYEGLSCSTQIGDCLQGEAFLSLSSETNAHIGNSEAYDLKICCSYNIEEKLPIDILRFPIRKLFSSMGILSLL